MYGVVLWSDEKRDRALIWCEDHGNLAFFNGQENRKNTLKLIDAGDLVKLDVRDTRDFRLATNVELVAAEEYPQLADTLLEVGENYLPKTSRTARGNDSNIIPFGRPQTVPVTEEAAEKPFCRSHKG